MVKKKFKGFSTLELLIACAVLTLSLTALISVFFGNQSVLSDTLVSTEALSEARASLEQTRALAFNDFLSATTTNQKSAGPLVFTLNTTVSDLTPCKKSVMSEVGWDSETLRPQNISLVTLLTDVIGALKMGGDCFTDGPQSQWGTPKRFASDTTPLSKALTLDVLDRRAYIAIDKAPFLKIAETKNASVGQTGGLFLSYTNSFDVGAQANALDAIRWKNPSTGTEAIYVFAAMDTVTNQLKVIDVTVPTAPVVVATLSLSSCVKGSYPQGWYLRAYGNSLYLVTRYTQGPELHIFDITTPTSPSEFPIGSSACKGFALGDTVEQILARDQMVNGVEKRLLYLATDENDREVRVLDVTNPLSIAEQVDVDLPGNTDGASLYLLGNTLYFGRLSGAGSDLFMFDVRVPIAPLPLLGSKDMGTDVLGIIVAGTKAFIATGKTNQEFQVWDVTVPSSLKIISSFSFSNLVGSGIDYEHDGIYAAGQSTPLFQMIYSP